MKRLFLPAIIAMVAFAVTACTDYDNGLTEKEIQFAENFRDVFGKIDPTQDWNLAERASVTVTVSQPTEVKVYAKNGSKYQIVADYQSVTGTQTLAFDVIEGTTELIVSDGSNAVRATVGGNAVLQSGTRTGAYGKTGKVTVSENTDESTWLVFDKDVAVQYADKLPEGINNLGKVTQNFSFVSTGAFVIYPVFWDTNDTDKVGVFYTDEEGYHEVPIYTIKSGNELEYTKTNASDSYVYCLAADAFDNDDSRIGGYCASGDLITGVGHDTDGFRAGQLLHTQHTDAEWAAVGDIKTSNSPMESNDPKAQYERSRGVIVNIPAGVTFGMYIYPSAYSKNYYSLQEKNGYDYGGTEKSVHAATFTLPDTNGDDQLYLCFEDWADASSDKDLNDVVFRFSGATPVVVDEDAAAWVVCAEDLGNTYDFDYNDVVFEVSHVAGKTEATVLPLAAGGTLASYLTFKKDGESPEQNLGEIHSFWGIPVQESGKYPMLNTSSTKPTTFANSFKIEVDEEWTMAPLSTTNIGGFSLRVVPRETMASWEAAVDNGYKIAPTTQAGSDNVPYVFCVPRDWKYETATHVVSGKYHWAKEKKSMSPTEDYGEGCYATIGHAFAEWVASKESSKDWFMYPDESTTVCNEPIQNTEKGSTQPPLTPGVPDGYELAGQLDGSGKNFTLTQDQISAITSASNKATFAVVTDGNIPAGTTVNVLIANQYNFSFETVESQTIYEFNATNIGNVIYNASVVFSNYTDGAIQSVWVKTEQSQGGGGHGGGSQQDLGTKIDFTQNVVMSLPLVNVSTTKVTFTVKLLTTWASMIMYSGDTKIITKEGDEWNSRVFAGSAGDTFVINITNPDHISSIVSNGIKITEYMSGNAELYYKVE